MAGLRQMSAAAYGSRRSPGRRRGLWRGRAKSISRRCLPELCSILARPKQEGAGKAGCRRHPRSAARMAHAKRPHSSIQVKPNTRPSLRDGLTAYVVLSSGSVALLPPSPLRPGLMRRRLAATSSRRLDAQYLGRRDHTILPYARFVGASEADGCVHLAADMMTRRT